MKILSTFAVFSGLKINNSKCEICGLGALKGVKVALCGITSKDLTSESIKILGLHFSYNEIIKKEKNFKKIVFDIEAILKIWRQRELSIEGVISI